MRSSASCFGKGNPSPGLAAKPRVSTPSPAGEFSRSKHLSYGKSHRTTSQRSVTGMAPLVNSTEICEDRRIFFFSYFLLFPLVMLSDTLWQQRVERSLEGAVAARLGMLFPIFHTARGGGPL